VVVVGLGLRRWPDGSVWQCPPPRGAPHPMARELRRPTDPGLALAPAHGEPHQRAAGRRQCDAGRAGAFGDRRNRPVVTFRGRRTLLPVTSRTRWRGAPPAGSGGNPPTCRGRQKWSYAASANFMDGVMPPNAIWGRSLWYVQSQRVADSCTAAIVSKSVCASQS